MNWAVAVDPVFSIFDRRLVTLLNFGVDEHVFAELLAGGLNAMLYQGCCNAMMTIARVDHQTVQMNGLRRLALEPYRAGVKCATAGHLALRCFSDIYLFSGAALHEHLVRIFF